MLEELVLVLVGGGIAILSNVVTSWSNRKLFRDELGEPEIFEVYVKTCQSLLKEVYTITDDAIQLVSHVVSISQQGKKQGKEEEEIRELIISEAEFGTKSSRILFQVMQLKRYFVLLPAPVINALKEYETTMWDILKNGRGLGQVYEIVIASDKLMDEIRLTTAEVMKREAKVSHLLSEQPGGGYYPEFVREAMRCSTQQGSGYAKS